MNNCVAGGGLACTKMSQRIFLILKKIKFKKIKIKLCEVEVPEREEGAGVR